MGKYDAWDRYFAQLEGEEMELSFEQLEAALGAPMPASAYKFDTWWSNAHYYATWANHGWFASPHIARRTVTFSRRRPLRGRRPAAVRTQKGRPETPETPGARPTDVARRLILVGCVAPKLDHRSPAKDLYTSPLWKKRRSYAESTGQPWGILSSEYGYVDPDTVIEPYDRYMGDQTRAYRNSWSQSTAGQVIGLCAQLGLNTVEVHAGATYLEHGLIAALNRVGIKVLWPLHGMRIGEQMSWYDRVNHGVEVSASAPTSELLDGGGNLSVERGEERKVQVTGDHVKRIAQMYASGSFGETWDDLPEMMRLPDAPPTQRRLWLTFTAAVDRARDAMQLWANADRAWDAEPWVFDPEQVSSRPFAELSDVLRRFGLSQRHSIDAQAWRLIGEALDTSECPTSIRDAIEGRPTRAVDLLEAVAETWPQGTPMFPLLSGPKIKVMWVRMLAFPGGTPIEGLDAVPVAVDTHVQRVTEMLGLAPVKKLDDPHRRRIQTVWFEGVAQAGSFGAPEAIDGTAAGIDPALWALGKEACSICESQKRKIPVGSVCDVCVLGRVR